MEEAKIKKRILVRHGSENAGHLGEEVEELCGRRNEQMADIAGRSQKKTGTRCCCLSIFVIQLSRVVHELLELIEWKLLAYNFSCFSS